MGVAELGAAFKPTMMPIILRDQFGGKSGGDPAGVAATVDRFGHLGVRVLLSYL